MQLQRLSAGGSKTKRPAAVVESSNEQAAAAEEAPNEEAGTAAAEEAPNKQPEDTPPDQQPGLSFVDWQLAQANIRLVVEEMLADPVAETINDVQPELAAADGQWAATPSGCSRASSVFFCIHCKKTFKSKNGFTRHSKTCKSQLKANEPETAVTAEAQAADAAPITDTICSAVSISASRRAHLASFDTVSAATCNTGASSSCRVAEGAATGRVRAKAEVEKLELSHATVSLGG